MKVNIKTIIAVVLATLVLSISTISKATENYSANMTLTSNSELKPGEVVTVSVNLTNINAGNGVDALTAQLNYDTNVFETLSTSDFSSNTGWNLSFSSKTNRMTAVRASKVSSPQAMFFINLKAKSLVNVNSTTITLQDIAISGGILQRGGTGDIEVNNASVSIKRAKENYSCAMQLTGNSNLKSGEIVKVTASLTNLNVGRGIDVLTAKVNYDTDVFETLSTSNFSSSTGWNLSFSENTNKMTAIKSSMVISPEKVFTINLKVKQGVNVDSTLVTIQNIVVSGGMVQKGGTGDIDVNNISVRLYKPTEYVSNTNNSASNMIQDEQTSNINTMTSQQNKEIKEQINNKLVELQAKKEEVKNNTELSEQEKEAIIKEIEKEEKQQKEELAELEKKEMTGENTELNKEFSLKENKEKITISNDGDSQKIKAVAAVGTATTASASTIGFVFRRKFKF